MGQPDNPNWLSQQPDNRARLREIAFGESLRTHTEINHALENPRFIRSGQFAPGATRAESRNGRQAPLHFRGHDEVETNRRACVFA